MFKKKKKENEINDDNNGGYSDSNKNDSEGVNLNDGKKNNYRSSLSALHDEKVENMKIKTEKMYKKKDRDLKKKLLKKEEIIKKQYTKLIIN